MDIQVPMIASWQVASSLTEKGEEDIPECCKCEMWSVLEVSHTKVKIRKRMLLYMSYQKKGKPGTPVSIVRYIKI